MFPRFLKFQHKVFKLHHRLNKSAKGESNMSRLTDGNAFYLSMRHKFLKARYSLLRNGNHCTWTSQRQKQALHVFPLTSYPIFSPHLNNFFLSGSPQTGKWQSRDKKESRIQLRLLQMYKHSSQGMCSFS